MSFHNLRRKTPEIIANTEEKSYVEMMQETLKKKNPAAKWIKRFGVAGFLFFLIKGLIWLAIFTAAFFFGYDLLS